MELKVKELIALLSKYDGELLVNTCCTGETYKKIPIRKVTEELGDEPLLVIES